MPLYSTRLFHSSVINSLYAERGREEEKSEVRLGSGKRVCRCARVWVGRWAGDGESSSIPPKLRAGYCSTWLGVEGSSREEDTKKTREGGVKETK